VFLQRATEFDFADTRSTNSPLAISCCCLHFSRVPTWVRRNACITQWGTVRTAHVGGPVNCPTHPPNQRQWQVGTKLGTAAQSTDGRKGHDWREGYDTSHDTKFHAGGVFPVVRQRVGQVARDAFPPVRALLHFYYFFRERAAGRAGVSEIWRWVRSSGCSLEVQSDALTPATGLMHYKRAPRFRGSRL